MASDREFSRKESSIARRGRWLAAIALVAWVNLAHAHDSPSLETLIERLKSPNPAFRAESLKAIGELGEGAKEATSAVGELLSDRALFERVEIRSLAAKALGEIGPAASATAPQLLEGMADPNPYMSLECEKALTAMGAAQIEAAMSALAGDKAQLRGVAARSLALLGAEAAQPLASALRDDRAEVRLYAARALGQIGKEAKAILPDLIEALKSAAGPAKVEIAKATWLIDRYPEAWTAITDCLADAPDETRLAAANCLTEIAADAIDQGSESVSRLSEGLADENAGIRVAFANALAALGEKSAGAAPSLLKLLGDDERAARRAAARALGVVGGLSSKSDILGLARGLEDADQGTRMATAKSLARLGKKAKAASSALVEALREDNEFVYKAVVEALKAVDPKAAAEAMLEANVE